MNFNKITNIMNKICQIKKIQIEYIPWGIGLPQLNVPFFVLNNLCSPKYSSHRNIELPQSPSHSSFKAEILKMIK